MRNIALNASAELPSRYQDKIVGREISLPPTERIYLNGGNPPLINLLSGDYHRVLDIGCGAGNNAALVKSKTRVRRIWNYALSRRSRTCSDIYEQVLGR